MWMKEKTETPTMRTLSARRGLEIGAPRRHFTVRRDTRMVCGSRNT